MSLIHKLVYSRCALLRSEQCCLRLLFHVDAPSYPWWSSVVYMAFSAAASMHVDTPSYPWWSSVCKAVSAAASMHVDTPSYPWWSRVCEAFSAAASMHVDTPSYSWWSSVCKAFLSSSKHACGHTFVPKVVQCWFLPVTVTLVAASCLEPSDESLENGTKLALNPHSATLLEAWHSCATAVARIISHLPAYLEAAVHAAA